MLGMSCSKLRRYTGSLQRRRARPGRTRIVPFLRSAKTKTTESQRTWFERSVWPNRTKSSNETKRKWTEEQVSGGGRARIMGTVGCPWSESRPTANWLKCRKLCTSQVQVPVPLSLDQSTLPYQTREILAGFSWCRFKQFIPFYKHHPRVWRGNNLMGEALGILPCDNPAKSGNIKRTFQPDVCYRAHFAYAYVYRWIDSRAGYGMRFEIFCCASILEEGKSCL